jgi:hypothetical protein
VNQVTQDIGKALALGNALLVCMVVPWFLCFLFYTFMHFTYPRDKAAALRAAAAEASAGLARSTSSAGLPLAEEEEEEEEQGGDEGISPGYCDGGVGTLCCH